MNYLTRKKYRPLLHTVDLAGKLMRPIFRIKPLPPVNKIKKILIIRIDEVGDVVLANPIITALKKSIPHASIDILVKPQMKEFVQHHPHINKVFTLESHLRGKTSLGLIRKTGKLLAGEHYDVVFDLHIDARNLYLAHLTDAAVLGYSERGAGFFISKSTAYKPSSHVIDLGLELVRTLTGKPPEKTYDFYLEPAALTHMKKIITTLGLKEKQFIIFNPGAGRTNKLWVEQKWAQVGDMLHAEHIVLIGTPQEVEMSERIISLMKRKAHMLTGTTTINQVAALISLSKGIISTDSGPVHIARFTHTPLVALFGPVDPGVWGYNEPKYRSVFVKLNCSFCNEGTCNNNPIKEQCMKDISVQTVYNTWQQVMQETA